MQRRWADLFDLLRQVFNLNRQLFTLQNAENCDKFISSFFPFFNIDIASIMNNFWLNFTCQTTKNMFNVHEWSDKNFMHIIFCHSIFFFIIEHKSCEISVNKITKNPSSFIVRNEKWKYRRNSSTAALHWRCQLSQILFSFIHVVLREKMTHKDNWIVYKNVNGA